MSAKRKTIDPLKWTVDYLRARFVAGLRVVGFLSLVALVAFAVLAKRAWASLAETSLEAGRGIAELGDVLGSTKTVHINGEAFHVSTGYVEMGVDEVLDRFQADCTKHEMGVVKLFEESVGPHAALMKATLEDARKPFGVARSSDENEGVVACLADHRTQRVPGIIQLARLAETGDLGQLGDMRYAYVKAVKGKHKSRVVAVWTEGSFNIVDMYPPTGDAPGGDSSVVARPVQSKRVLTAVSDNAPYGVRIYESSATPDTIYATFDEDMKKLDWERVIDADVAPDHRIFMHSSGVLCETFARRIQGKTQFSTVELGHTDRPLSPQFDP
ncbi:hypothetical protein EON77_13510 [bacterium]|nr:MAG: hypothetical protein EON77_13510 [bacterium]